MRKTALAAALAAPFALILYLFPSHHWVAWRLSLAGFWTWVHPANPNDGLFPSDSGRIADLLARLEEKDVEIARLRGELRDAGLARDAYPTLSFLGATVVAVGVPGDPNAFIIDRGAEDGVRRGDAVLSGAALAGTVARAGKGVSLVSSVGSEGSYIPARLGRSPEGEERPRARDWCAVRGEGNGKARVVFFSKESAVGQGWTVLTSEMGTLPPDVRIGEVAGEPWAGRMAGTWEAELHPAARWTALDRVLVVTRVDAERLSEAISSLTETNR